ncbi:hypothetical protein HBA55_36475 [Pseudomaricurvus alkylphenolicus]|uniref:hypothetical protein n=1 Tax=Pseudomaricurvus alkylphenolicus TaxID=1306991 RepID=UPI0014247F0B|nr:hypothetical protein [Pseudomaricurvus alkylphenolicus]NIB45132.1 hypothetical protein [Pseudomaricurvus alkylphenolicus]
MTNIYYKLEDEKTAVKLVARHGEICYQLWKNRNGNVYIEVTRNSGSGTVPRGIVYPADEILARLPPLDQRSRVRNHKGLRGLIGYEIDSGNPVTRDNNNVSGFLKAAAIDHFSFSNQEEALSSGQ